MTRRQRGTGRVFLPKGSSVWWLQYYLNGVKQRESSGTSDRREALDKLKLRIAELTTGAVTGLSPKKTRIAEPYIPFSIDELRLVVRVDVVGLRTGWGRPVQVKMKPLVWKAHHNGLIVIRSPKAFVSVKKLLGVLGEHRVDRRIFFRDLAGSGHGRWCRVGHNDSIRVQQEPIDWQMSLSCFEVSGSR